MASEEKRNYIWLAVLVSVIVVVSIGAYTFRSIASPATQPTERDERRPWIIDANRPWIEDSSRPFDIGAVPFVPAKSRYSDHDVPTVPLPAPEAIRPNAEGRSR